MPSAAYPFVSLFAFQVTYVQPWAPISSLQIACWARIRLPYLRLRLSCTFCSPDPTYYLYIGEPAADLDASPDWETRYL